MSQAIDTRNAGLAAASKRLARSAAITHVASTGVFTLSAAGFLDDLAPGDVVTFSALTGGSVVSTTTDYYLLLPRWAAGALTFKVSATPDGTALTGGTNITAGTVSSGRLTAAADGVLSGNIISADSPRGR